MRALFDGNVLIALLDVDHVHHRAAHGWLDTHMAAGWASCPLTQNGCVRIMSQPAYPGALPPAAIAERLRAATIARWHRFWPDDLSLLDTARIRSDRLLGARQVTDAYLLALAVHHGGRLVTFDRNVPTAAVEGAEPRHLVIL